MIRQAVIYRVVGRDPGGRVAVRLRVAAVGIHEALRIAQQWDAERPYRSNPIRFGLVDIHRSADEPVITSYELETSNA